MPDLELLSKRCKKYRIKRFLKFTFPLFFLLIIVFALFNYQNFLNIEPKSENQKMVTVKIEEKSIKRKKREEKPKETPKRVKKSAKVENGVKVVQFLAVSKGGKEGLSDEKRRFESMGFSCYIKKDIDDYFKLRCLIPKNFDEIKKILKDKKIDFFLPTESKEFLEQLNLKISNISTVVNRPLEEKKSAVKGEPPIKKEENSYRLDRAPVSSLIASKKATVEELIKQFSRRPGFSRAIMISKAFYKRRDYKNAAKWAKKANSLDREREEGWILYAKSIYALGHKERAVKILKLYLSFKSSSEARKLLMQFERGIR